ncbi:g10493 [Coccomyxa viridis]|uniref:G10493 protein n=1 Tax=Coccomyxa viridis TaxID=1274662 RepID=A0ABP1GA14_9CHLO
MPSRQRQHGTRKPTRKPKRTLGDKMLSCLCGVEPRVVENDPPLCSAEEFRAMHQRKDMKGQQIQTVGPIHWLHPRAIMVATLYDSIVLCPGAPQRLLDCLLFHKSLIRYQDPHPGMAGWQHCTTASLRSEEVNSPAEVPEEAACDGSSADLAAAEGGSTGLAEARSWSGDLAAVKGSSIAAEDEAASQALERLESAGEAACCLNDTFEKEQLEAAALQEELNQNQADLEAIHKILSSPFVQRDAMREAEHEDFKMSASPKRHGTRQPVIKLTASSATSDSPVARALFQLETQEERRQRFKTAGKAGNADSDAKAAERASEMASKAANSAAASAAAAKADAETEKSTEMCTLLDTMSTETGERNAQAAHRTALETVIEDTEAELAKLQRSKVASMIRLYQGMESPQRDSPKIGARHSPQPQKKLDNPLIPAITAPDTLSEAATNTVSSWLQKDNLLDSGIPSPVAAAAQQLHDERPLRKTTEDLRPLTPARRHNAEHLTFSTPSANLYEENDHSLWSSSFTSQQGPCEGVQVNPEKAAKHAAAAARKALEAAQHAHKAAMYAGLQQQNAYEVQTWHTNSKYLDTATTESGMATFHNLLFEPAF